MATANDVLVYALAGSQSMMNRFCADLTPEEYLHRPCAAGNTTAWIVGHLVLTERTALGRAGVTALPELPEGFEKRFARDAEAPKADTFGDVSLLLPLFNRHRELMIETAKGLPADAFERPIEHPRFKMLGEFLAYLGGTHVAMHAGQITIIRRSLGRPPLV